MTQCGSVFQLTSHRTSCLFQDVNSRLPGGDTPLHIAARWVGRRTARVLLISLHEPARTPATVHATPRCRHASPPGVPPSPPVSPPRPPYRPLCLVFHVGPLSPVLLPPRAAAPCRPSMRARLTLWCLMLADTLCLPMYTWHLCRYGRRGVTCHLLELNADRLCLNDAGESPLAVACRNGRQLLSYFLACK